jgi:hypothetical protein
VKLEFLREKSDALAEDLYALLAELPDDIDAPRFRVSKAACSIAFEHWDAIRVLLGSEALTSGAVLQRAQFEAVVRSIWLLYAASDTYVIKLSSNLTPEADQAAKNIPLVAEMMGVLSTKAPPTAYRPLLEFKEPLWGVLNSYVHAGLHPLHWHGIGYPTNVVENMLRNSNNLGVLTCMQAVVVAGLQPLQSEVIRIAERHENCLPPRRAA